MKARDMVVELHPSREQALRMSRIDLAAIAARVKSGQFTVQLVQGSYMLWGYTVLSESCAEGERSRSEGKCAGYTIKEIK